MITPIAFDFEFINIVVIIGLIHPDQHSYAVDKITFLLKLVFFQDYSQMSNKWHHFLLMNILNFLYKISIYTHIFADVRCLRLQGSLALKCERLCIKTIIRKIYFIHFCRAIFDFLIFPIGGHVYVLAQAILCKRHTYVKPDDFMDPKGAPIVAPNNPFVWQYHQGIFRHT